MEPNKWGPVEYTKRKESKKVSKPNPMKWINEEKRKQKGQQTQPNVLNNWREKKAKWVNKPNPIYGRKPIMPLYKGIRMNSDSAESKVRWNRTKPQQQETHEKENKTKS